MKKLLSLMLAILILAPVMASAHEIEPTPFAIEGRVTYDFEPSSAVPSPMNAYTSEYTFIDADMAAKVLFDDEDYLVQTTYDDDRVLDYVVCSNDDAQLRSTRYGYFAYSTDNIKYSKDILTYAFEDNASDDLSFMSKADAIELCEDTFEKLGISAQAYEIESFDIAALKKLSDDNRDEQQEWLDLGKEAYIKDDWTQDDECYRIKLYQTIDGVPVTTRGYYIKSRDLPLGGTYLDALVTRSGVEYIYAYGLLKTLEIAESITPCTQKEALEAYIVEKNSTVEGMDIHLASMDMRYVPVAIPGENQTKKVTMTPVWMLGMQFQQTEDDAVRTYIYEVYRDITNGDDITK